MNTSISITKAIGIILMVLAHTAFNETCGIWINQFHMPLFFLVAGYCFKEKHLADPRGFVMKRVKGLYFPWVKYVVIFTLLHNVFFHLNIYSDVYGFRGRVSELMTWQEIGRGVLDAFLFRGGSQLLGGYWFIYSLFWASLMAFATIWGLKYVIRCKSERNKIIIGGGVLLIAALALALTDCHVPLLGIRHKEIVGALYFFVGYRYAHHVLRWHEHWLAPVVGLAIVTLATFVWPCGMLSFKAWQIVPYSISALAGTLLVHYVSTRIDRHDGRLRRALIYVGNNTLPILTWHFLSFKIVSLAIVHIYGLPSEQLAEFPAIEEYSQRGWWVAYLVVGTCVPLLIGKLESRN